MGYFELPIFLSLGVHCNYCSSALSPCLIFMIENSLDSLNLE